MRIGLIHALYNLKTILGCLGLGLALGLFAALITPPTYTAETSLLLRVGAAEASQDGLGEPRPYQGEEAVDRALQSDVAIIRSQPVITDALDRMSPEPPSTGLRNRVDRVLRARAERRTLERFNRDLSVGVKPRSSVIRIAFTSPDRERALAAVEAVSAAYVARRSLLYLNGGGGRQDGQIEHYAAMLDATEAEIQRVRLDYDVLDITKDVALTSDRLDGLTGRMAQARERLSVVGAELIATDRTLSREPARVLDSQERTNATPNDEARNTLLRLRQERTHVAAQYAADWPGLIELDAKIASAQTQIAENNLDIRSSERTVRNPVISELASRRAGLAIERDAVSRQAAELAAQVEAVRQRANQLREADMRLHDLERSRAASETIYRALLVSRAGSRIEDQALDDHSTSLRVVQPPTAPLRGRSVRPALALAGLLLGIAAAIVAVTVATVLRQTFITPDEAERALRVPRFMDFDAHESAWRSLAGSKAADRLADRLADVRIDAQPVRIVQILGEDPTSRARLALALARAMARRGEGQVLLIDGDMADRYRASASPQNLRRLPTGPGHLDVAQMGEPALWAAVAPGTSSIGDARSSIEDLGRTMILLRNAFARVIIAADGPFDSPAALRRHSVADANLLMITAEVTRGPVAARMRDTVLSAGGDLLGFLFIQRRRYIPEAIYRWL